MSTVAPAPRAAATYASAAARTAGGRGAAPRVTKRTRWTRSGLNSGLANIAGDWSPSPMATGVRAWAAGTAARAAASAATRATASAATRAGGWRRTAPGRYFFLAVGVGFG